jgi:hypothetical protein
MQVELDIFSGRPNPRWDLTPAEALKFRKMVTALPSSARRSPLAGGLGYRGLIVRPPGNKPEDFDELVIYNEVVTARRGDRSKAFVDKGRLLEKWLLSTGKRFLERSLFLEVLSGIEKG